MFLKLGLVFLIAILLSECDTRRNRNRNRNRSRQGNENQSLSRKQQRFARAVNDFGVSLFNELAPDNVNLVLAPVSALTAMSMVMLGAAGDTKQNLFQGLKLLPLRRPRKVHRAFKRFIRSMSEPVQNVTFDTGNAIYVREEAAEGELFSNFRRNIKRFYDGETHNFNFTHPQGPEAPINEWVEMNTRGIIQDFLSQGAIDDDTVMWLINAVYFKGTWENIFDNMMTRRQRFQLSSNVEIQVDMMNQDDSYATKYNADLAVKVLELPYVGERFSFFVILPDEIGLTNLESRLNNDLLEGLVTNLGPPLQYMISIPKFTLSSDLDLVQPLKDIGVTDVFTRGVADLSKLSDWPNLWVDKVKQNAVLEVNEHGTVATAVTAVRVVAESAPFIQHRFTVDRPFMFVLRDKFKAVNMFIGRVNNPNDTE